MSALWMSHYRQRLKESSLCAPLKLWVIKKLQNQNQPSWWMKQKGEITGHSFSLQIYSRGRPSAGQEAPMWGSCYQQNHNNLLFLGKGNNCKRNPHSIYGYDHICSQSISIYCHNAALNSHRAHFNRIYLNFVNVNKVICMSKVGSWITAMGTPDWWIFCYDNLVTVLLSPNPQGIYWFEGGTYHVRLTTMPEWAWDEASGKKSKKNKEINHLSWNILSSSVIIMYNNRITLYVYRLCPSVSLR